MVYVGQMTLNPIIAPLARDLGLQDWQVGVTISSAALMVVLTSQVWGRRAQALGAKPVLVAALSMAVITMALFTWVTAVGLSGGLSALFLLLRGVAFGVAIAAVLPTAQSYIAEVTDDGPERVKGMAGIGAVQGLASILGAIIGGALAGFGLLVPIGVIPLMIGISLILVALQLGHGERGQLIAAPKRVSPADARIWPFLLAGFGMFTALGFIQVTAGFLIKDRLLLGSEEAGQITGLMMLCMGLGMVLSQVVIVPKSTWAPPTLLRVGTVVSALGFCGPAPGDGNVAVARCLLAAGSGARDRHPRVHGGAHHGAA